MAIGDSITKPTARIGGATFEEIPSDEICARVFAMGMSLKVYESYTAYLGIGDVTVRILPRAIKFTIVSNDKQTPEVTVIVPTEYALGSRGLKAAIERYLRPVLEDVFYEYTD